MTTISDLMDRNITVTLKTSDLRIFAEDIANRIIAEQKPPNETKQEYLTGQQVCEKLNICRVTLYNWDRKGITTPVRMGNLKRYRLTDIEEIGK